jgi:hypothetical protein
MSTKGGTVYYAIPLEFEQCSYKSLQDIDLDSETGSPSIGWMNLSTIVFAGNIYRVS